MNVQAMIQRFTDDGIIFRHVRGYAELQKIKKALIVDRTRTAELICGPSGSGKSFNLEPGRCYDKRYGLIYFGGEASHCEAHEAIADAVAGRPWNKHPAIVMNDLGALLFEKGFVAFLQQLLSKTPLREGRVLSYKTRAMPGEKQRFTCHSPTLLIMNELPAHLTETTYSLLTRTGKVTIFDPSVEEMHRFMRRWAKSKDQQAVYRFVGENVASGVIKNHHLRWYDVLVEEKNAGDNPDWRKWAVDQWLQLAAPNGATASNGRRNENERGKLQIAALLYPEFAKAKRGQKAALYARYSEQCEAQGITGGCVKDFYNTVNKYAQLKRA